MSIKKLAYYLEGAEVTLRSDHLPLKKFLAKNTLNSKVNNRAIEISLFKITFEYIEGIKNTLAGTMSRLIEIDPQSKQEPEPKGYEFHYYVFDNLPNIEVHDIEMTINSTTDAEMKDTTGNNFQGFPIDTNTLQELQHNDFFAQTFLVKLRKATYRKGRCT